MAHLIELDGVRPTIGEDVFLAPTAVLIGNVHVGDRSSVWFGAVLRGDLSRIEIGERCSIQDTAVIHCAIDLPTIIGDAVTVGHGALLEGCTIEDGAVIGMGAIVLQHAHVGERTMIAAGGVVPERMTVAAGRAGRGRAGDRAQGALGLGGALVGDGRRGLPGAAPPLPGPGTETVAPR